MKSDETLLAEFQSGNVGAFEELYRSYRVRIHNYCLSILQDEGEAEEAMQEVFYKMLKRPQAIRLERTFRNYVYASARNAALDRWRRTRGSRRMVRATTSLLMPLAEPAADPAAQREQALRVSNALLDLPDEQREAVILKVFHGLSHREIADITGSEVGTVISRYHYGLQKLRDLLGGTI